MKILDSLAQKTKILYYLVLVKILLEICCLHVQVFISAFLIRLFFGKKL